MHWLKKKKEEKEKKEKESAVSLMRGTIIVSRYTEDDYESFQRESRLKREERENWNTAMDV